MVGWWPGDGNGKDIVGGNSLAFSGNVLFAGGMVGQAFSFDGNSHATTGVPSALVGKTNYVSVEAWVFVPSASDKGAFVKVGGAPNGFGVGVGGNSFDNSGNQFIGLYEHVRWLPTYRSIGTGWHHVAFVISGRPILYLDGAPLYPGYGLPKGPTGSIGIGAYGGGGRYFFGKVDEVTVYGRALSPGEVKQIFNAGSAGKCK